ncbi:MAG: FAD-binding oxidoreductase [Dermatophilaceae bacterium]
MVAFTGRYVERGEEGFEAAVLGRVFNQRRPARRPAAVLFAADVDDVRAGVRLAAQRGWQVSVRSGGHSWAAWSVREDALLVDLAAFSGIEVDEPSGLVRAGPAVRGGAELDPFLQQRGWFFNGGHCPTVGIGGFLLQGGMGWNCRGWNWACEMVEALDVVTADGELLRCDASQNADLFWAARGAGPGFPGIVVRFHLRARPRFRSLTQSTYIYPRELAAEVFTWLHQARWEVPGSVEIVAVGIRPPLPPQVSYDGSVIVVDGVCFEDEPADAARALAPLGACPVADQALVSRVAQPTTMAALRAEQVRANPEGHRYTVDNAYLVGETAQVVPALVPAFTTLPTSKAFSLWFDMGAAPQRPLDMALSLQSDLYFATYVVAEDPNEDAVCRDWVDATMTRLEPLTVGCYIGDSDLERRPQKFLSDEAFARLRAIRRDRDPQGRFPDYLVAPGYPVNVNPWQAG